MSTAVVTTDRDEGGEPTRWTSLLEPLLERAARAPDWPGLVLLAEEGARYTVAAGELARRAADAAARLSAAGLRRGEIAVLVMDHTLELVEAFLGALWLGAVPTIFAGYAADRLDGAVHRRRLASVLRTPGVRAVLTLAPRLELMREVAAGTECRVWSDEELRAAPAPPAPAAVRTAPGDAAFVQFTSGSGGAPKAIVHSHGRVLRYLEAKRVAQPIRGGDVIVSWLPLYHDLGLVSGLLAPQVLGVRSVLMSPAHWVRDPAILLRAISDFGGTLCFMPNFALNHCARAVRERDLEGLDLSSWRALVCGGEPVREGSLRAFAARFASCGFREEALRPGYGMAELVEAATVTPPGRRPRVDRVDAAALRERAVALPSGSGETAALVSCGRPLPGVRLRIADDSGAALPERTVGEIHVHADYLFEGYRGADGEASFLDGWFLTGDLGYLADGELYVTGRKKDLVIVSGRNVNPEDVEFLAEGLPGLHPGRTVAFGVADERAGTERIIVVAEAGADTTPDARRAVERELRRRAVEALGIALGEVRIVARGWVIKTSSGKNARPQNREKYEAELARR